MSAACTTLLGDVPEGTPIERSRRPSQHPAAEDGAAQDGGTDDPGSGAANDGAPAPKSFCATLTTPVTFCRDFDDGRVFSADFATAATNGCTITSDSTDPVSKPKSLVAEVSADLPDPYALMYRVFDGIKPTDIRLSLDIRLEAAGSGTQEACAFEIVTQFDTPNEHDIYLNLNANRWYLREYFGYQRNAQWWDYEFSGRSIQMGQWAHLDVHVSSSRISALLDGTTIVADQPLHKPWVPQAAELDLGVTYVLVTGSAWRIRYDNIVFDLH